VIECLCDAPRSRRHLPRRHAAARPRTETAGRRSGLSGTATESHHLHRGVCPRTGPPPGDAAVSGACTLSSVTVRGPEGDAGRRPRVRAEEPSLRRNLSSGRSAHARWPAAGPPARLESETNKSLNRTLNSIVAAHYAPRSFVRSRSRRGRRRRGSSSSISRTTLLTRAGRTLKALPISRPVKPVSFRAR
jgi:hypothetical protein